MYLITSTTNPPFITKWYTYDNNYVEGTGMIVYDLEKNHYTTDGESWQEIETDHL
jgi:hypothetical protein